MEAPPYAGRVLFQVVSPDGTRLVAVDRATGHELWSAAMEHATQVFPVGGVVVTQEGEHRLPASS